jgi:hypothetical protein
MIKNPIKEHRDYLIDLLRQDKVWLRTHEPSPHRSKFIRINELIDYLSDLTDEVKETMPHKPKPKKPKK